MKEGRLYLLAEYSKMIWICLAEEAVCSNDREQCFRWFAEVRIQYTMERTFKLYDLI